MISSTSIPHKSDGSFADGVTSCDAVSAGSSATAPDSSRSSASVLPRSPFAPVSFLCPYYLFFHIIFKKANLNYECEISGDLSVTLNHMASKNIVLTT